MKFENVRGMRDFLSNDLAKRRLVEDKARECFHLYGYEEIETPVLESLDLIEAKAGDDIRHRMYSFKDRGGRKVALRPEMTASVARLVSSKLRSEPKPLRLGYITNCFRYDNPQMGRYREFWQAGFELFGSARAEADAEIILIFHDMMQKLGFRNFTLKIGHVGILRGLLSSEEVNENDQNVIMGLLDKRRIKAALTFLDNLKVSESCVAAVKKLIKLKGEDWSKVIVEGREALKEYEKAQAALSNLEDIIQLSSEGGVKANMIADLGFTRGLEYYTGMILEVFVPNLGIALGGGGRYDRLVELFGGDQTPAVGCSPGIDRIVLALEMESLLLESLIKPVNVLIIPVGDELVGKALSLAAELRGKGISTQVEISGKGIGAALSYADKKRFHLAIIIGPREAEKGCLVIRNMQSKMQREVQMNNVEMEILKDLNLKPS